MDKLKILVSGGGLAGLTAAYWLRKHGHEPVVIERAPGLRRDGYGLDFFGTGYDVAERMGIIESLAQTQIFMNKGSGIAFVNEDGKPVAELKTDAVRKILGGKYMGLMHYNLEEVLYDAVKGDVEIRFGTSILAVTQSAESVAVTYENGDSETFDLLVGTDGIHSNVRNLVFGPEKEFAYYLGYYLACYYIPDKYQLQATWANYTEPGRQVGAYNTDREGQLATLFLWRAEDEGYIPPDKRAEKLQNAFKDMGWITPQILEEIPANGNDILIDTVTQIRMDTWRKGRVVLVGDAAGCMTLISGQGASMALGGAYVLAEELGQSEDWRQALANYEHRVKPQMDLRQRKAHDFAKQFVPGSKLGVKAEIVMMKLVTYQAFSGLLKSQFVGDSFLQTAAVHRLPESHNNILGYRIAGKLQETDYDTLAMGMDEALQSSDRVNLLLHLDDIEGIKRGALMDDWKFGRKYHEKTGRLAVVGNKKWEKWMTKLSSPFYAQETKFFHSDKMPLAWQWLNDAA
jgi:2-polyprenyl-6-methoxyphenol hydroxylase-like FAD-dependent oxidoreductase